MKRCYVALQKTNMRNFGGLEEEGGGGGGGGGGDGEAMQHATFTKPRYRNLIYVVMHPGMVW